MKHQLLTERDIQDAFAKHLRGLREQAKLSRDSLAERSGVPAATIKRFELTGNISFRQLLSLWQTLDDIKRLYALTQNTQQPFNPLSIAEVWRNDQ
ncbi:transcriptional regulator [Idiomarina tyrosinivorans]|uniref:Transcriptional regulator n=1 Tax=Idiomarina tyrosinivorans TaxID=1445662 RepID=A0A432ZRB9_9GAMM|nr:helix-turn-helix transcriptional regulator [Idiomarina tyrosinivorans]RUO80376.1 transcriptional regulator [Idiomarina tyrosinivorans]